MFAVVLRGSLNMRFRHVFTSAGESNDARAISVGEVTLKT